MFRIYLDDILIHDPLLSSTGLVVSNPTLDITLNKTNALQFVIYPTNPHYDKVVKTTSIYTVYDDDILKFRGRLLNDTLNFNRAKSVYVEGDLAFLLDTIVRPFTLVGTPETYLHYILSQHNLKCGNDKKIELGRMNIDDERVRFTCGDYSTTYTAFTDGLVSNFGGYFRTRHVGDKTFLDYTKDIGKLSSQVIRFGDNMLDFSRSMDANDIFTRIIPLGTDGDGNYVSISSVNNGKDYLENAKAIRSMGVIEKAVPFDFTDNPRLVKILGKRYLESCLEATFSVELSIVDMHNLNVDVDEIDVGDKLRVQSDYHNIDQIFRCTSINYDMTVPYKSKYTFDANYADVLE